MKYIKPGVLLVYIALGFFVFRLAEAGYETYRCEDMLIVEEEHDMHQYQARDTSYNFKKKCNIPFYGMEWISVVNDDEDDDE